MGCKKLSYYQKEEVQGLNWKIFEGGQANLGLSKKKGLNYSTFGKPLPSRNYTSSTLTNRRGYQGQFSELDEETGYNFFELRSYDAEVGRFTTFDPYNQFHSPYIGLGNNPISLVDPDGGFAGGIFCFLGTTVGQAAVGAATSASIGITSGMMNSGGYESGDVIERLTLSQANKHYRDGEGEALTVNAAKVDLSGVDRSRLKLDKPVEVNLSTNGSRDGLVYGKLALTLRSNGRVDITTNTYDFDTGVGPGGVGGHPWFGKNSSFWRNLATKAGNIVARSGKGYPIIFKGQGDLNYKPKPFVPQFPTGFKL